MSEFGWQGLRRDFLAGLVGAAITAGVLVPLGWSRVSAEQRQSDRLRRELELLEREDAGGARSDAQLRDEPERRPTADRRDR